MSFFGRLFSTEPIVVVPPTAALTFSERVTEELNSLQSFVRSASGVVSGEVFSQLRYFDDVVRNLLVYVADKEVSADQEFLLESAVTDYVPTPLKVFLQLPVEDQGEGGKGDLLLTRQYDTIVRNVESLADHIRGQALEALNTHAVFIDEKFRGV